MPAKKSYLLPLLLLPALLSCRPADRSFEQDYARALAQNRGEELMLALLELDQAYPDRIKVKITLGGMLLAAGDLPRAQIILERGEQLARRCRDAALVGLLFTNLAELYYRRQEYARGADCAARALQAAPDQMRGVIFTGAKCLFALGRYDEALDSFRRARESEVMTGEDLEVYTALLAGRGLSDQALTVLRDREHRHGYLPGLGLLESAVLERMGRTDEAVIAAAKDMEYRRSLGLLDDTLLLERLETLTGLLPDVSPHRSGGELTAAAYTAYVRGQWRLSASLLTELDLRAPMPFYDYLLAAALLESGADDPELLATFRRLEPEFRLLPAYYYHLWRGLKAVGEYTIFSARPVLERCILLAPHTLYARESRAELGLLLGLSAAEGEKLLLGAELDSLYERLQAGADPQILQPVLDMLALPDNIYRSAAVMILEQARRVPAVAAYLASQPQPSASPVTE